MRTLSSILVGILALVALCGFFVLHSVISYLEDPGAVAETAREQALHGRMVELGESILMDEMRSAGLYEGRLQEFVRNEAREVWVEVFAPSWFYRAFQDGHAAALALVYGRAPKPIDLRHPKEVLGRGLEGVGHAVMEQCRELIGTPSCDDDDSRRRMLAPALHAIQRAVDDIPDTLEIETVAAWAGVEWFRRDSPRMKRARQVLDWTKVARYIALGATLLFFLVIGVSNRSPIGRLLVVLGLATCLTSAGFLVAVHMADRWLEEPLERVLVEVRSRVSGDAALDGVVSAGAEDLTRGVAHDAIHGSDDMVIGLGGLGLIFVVVGMLVYRRTSAHGFASGLQSAMRS